MGSKLATWETRVSMPIVTYLIRPSYTFPYTDKYLEKDVFQFSKKGLAQNIITSGKIVLPNSWVVSVTSNFFTNSKGEQIENGVSPKIAIENTTADMTGQHDKMLEKAMGF